MRRRTPVLLLLAPVLVLAACNGGGTTEADRSESPTTTVEVSTTTTSPGAAATAPPTTETAESIDLTLTPADGWVAVSLGRGVKPVVALHPDGTPGIAWLLERIGGFVAFANAANDWEVEMVARGYFYGPIGLAFSPDGDPNIVIHDHEADDFDPQLGNLARLLRDGDRWVKDTARDPGHDGWDATIVIGDDGVIHAAGVDPAQFGRTEGVEYYRNAGDGWEVTQIGSGPISYQYNVGLALDPSGSPALSYYRDAEPSLWFASLVDGTWELELVSEDGNSGKYSSLAFTRDGRPAISYFNQQKEDVGEIRYTVKDGDGWTVEMVDVIHAFSERNARRNSSLAFDSQGRAHVAFSDTSGVWYSVREDGGWETEQIVTGELPLGQLVSLVLDPSDQPHIALYEITNEQSLDGVIAYLTRG